MATDLRLACPRHMAGEMREHRAIGSSHFAFVGLSNALLSHTPHCWSVADPTQHCALGRTNNLPRSTLSQTRKPKSLTGDSCGVRAFMESARSYEAAVSLDSAEDCSSTCRLAIDSRSQAR